MNELLVIFYILATLAFAYLWFYPKVVGDNVKLMAWLDILVSGIPLGISAILYWDSDPQFNFFGLSLNWFLYTLIVMLLIELPIFLLYLRARGLSRAYWAAALGGSRESMWVTASASEVAKQLDDTKWDGLRSAGAKRFLLISSNVILIGSTALLLFIGDNEWTIYSIIHILLIFSSWFLLRQSVRLVADAPEEALDEMLLQRRNQSYVLAYRWLAAIAVTFAALAFGWSVGSDFQEDSDGFNYLLSVTWPQIQALFWFLFGYSVMLPSMAMLSLDLKRRNKGK